MSIGNIKNTNDLQNKKQEFSEYLQLMIDNEGIKEKRIKDYKNPNKPPPVPPQYKSASDQAKDLMTQERLAIDNLKELGIDLAEVRSFVLQLEQKQDGIDNLVKLNRNYPAFKKLISEKYLAKTLTAPLLLNAWEEFSANINAITGLKSVSSNSTSVYSNASDNYKKLPIQDDILVFVKIANENLFTSSLLIISDTLKTSLLKSLDEASKFLLNKETVNKIDDFPTPLEKRDINNLAENLLTLYKIPTDTDLKNKISSITNLLNSLTDINSVTINDAINKELIILNRFLSSFLNETAQKKLTEYNKFVNDKIFNLESSIKKETTIQNIPDSENEIPESYFKDLEKSKVKSIKTFMQLGLYKNSKYINEITEDMLDYGLDSKIPKDVIEYLNIKPANYTANMVRNFTMTSRVNKTLRTKKDTERRNLILLRLNKFKELNLELADVQEMLDIIMRQPFESDEQYNDIAYKGKELINNKDELLKFIVELGVGDTEYNRNIDQILFQVYEYFSNLDDVRGLDKPPPTKGARRPSEEEIKKLINDNKKYLYEKFLTFDLSREQIQQLFNAVYGYIYKSPDSVKRDKALEELDLSMQDLVNEGDKTAEMDLVYAICGLNYYSKEVYDYLYGMVDAYEANPDIQEMNQNKGLQAEEGNTGGLQAKTRGEREIELKAMKAKPDLQDIHFIYYNSKGGSKSKEKIVQAILDKEYPKSGSGLRKKKKGGDLIHIDIGSHIGKHYKEASGKGVNRQMKLFDKAKKEYQSGGDQPYIKSRIKVGAGVQLEESKPKYERFGKFIIHTPQLHKNILNFKYPSEGRVPNLPRMNIDDDTKDLIFNILETGKLSENQFAKLPQPIQDHLIKAIKGAGLENILFKGKCKVYPKDEKEDRDRFNVLKGEFDAGNDNPKLIKELRGLVIKFSNCGIIPKKQGLEFLTILNEI